jgi:hypothetical protein
MEMDMRPKREFTDRQKKEVEKALGEVKGKDEYQRVQAVWLRIRFGYQAAKIADILGMNVGSIWKIHFRFFKYGAGIFRNGSKGGRLHENLSGKEEAAFLSPFVKAAEKSGILVITQIKKIYEGRLGRKVPKSTVYRILERHGWRKIAPRPYHPKSDRKAQEDFKKNSAVSWKASGLKSRAAEEYV